MARVLTVGPPAGFAEPLRIPFAVKRTIARDPRMGCRRAVSFPATLRPWYPSPMSPMVADSDIRAYYTAALVGLRYIEQQKPTDRRFGANADARWASFKGDLTTADRLDLLIRDADAHWVGSFGARTVFAMEAVSEDDPFGPTWVPLDAVDAEEVWRGELAKDGPDSVAGALSEAAKAWGLSPSTMDKPTVAAADKLVVVGPGAIIAAAQAFAEGSDLDWSDQVTCIATQAAHRQLAAMAAGLLGATKASTILTATSAGQASLSGRRLLLSDDADDADAAAAKEAAG